MKCLIYAVFLVTLARIGESGYFTVPHSLRPEVINGKICEPGTQWRSRCNACSCTQDGRPLCEQNSCPGQDGYPELDCSPGSRWMNDCNSCWCTSGGKAVCTRIGCDEEAITIDFAPSEVKEVETKIFEAGSKIKSQYEVSIKDQKLQEDDENRIELSDDTIRRNEPMKMFEQPRSGINHFAKRSVCKPFEKFLNDCNTCECAANGQRYACSQNECMDGKDVDKEVEVFMESEGLDHIERHSLCKPRATFYIGCNTCNCNYDGSDYSCTNKPCPLPDDVELFHELKENKSNKTVVCVANRMFIRDCNTCWCNEDGTSYFCTRKVCIPELPEESAAEEGKREELRVIQKECRPDEVFEIDCNMCRCNPDGKSFSCTRRACVEQPEDDNKNLKTVSRRTRGAQLNQKELPKNCQPGQEFRMDCNKCLCDNEGQDFSCTRIDCNALNNNNNGGSRRKRDATEQVSTECTPGSVFERGCNVCRCKSDGLSADCTTHSCDTASHNSNALNNDIHPSAPESESGFRCNPGEQFKRSCNDCTCSADGRSVFCTLRLCDKDLVPSI